MKPWYLSKTLWVNALAAVAMFAQNQFGYILSPEVQAYVLVVANILLRTVTHEELSA